jgi:outer membrane protein assembly factor BamB
MTPHKLLPIISALVFGGYLAAESGDVRWTYTLSSGAKIFSAAAIDDAGNLFFGANDGVFYSLDANGNLRWTYTRAGDWIDSSPALTPDGGVVFGCWDGKVYCLDRTTGTHRWRYPDSFGAFGPIVGSPAVAEDGSVYFGSFDGIVYGLTSGGELDWFYVADAEVESSVALCNDGNLFFGDSAGTVYSLTPDGALRWMTALPPYAREGVVDFEIIASVALGLDDEVYVASRAGDLMQLDKLDGLVQWAFPMSAWIDSSPVVRTDGVGSRDGSLGIDGLRLARWR